ncbi:MAG: HNH endonuclease [Spirochaetales bacterium]
MSNTKIPEFTVKALWAQASGRCEFPGCNAILYRDGLTQFRGNSSYVAHIVADKPGGPRGDPELSPKLSTDLSNLMLLCDTHHRLIDREQVELYGVQVLRAYKKSHEERIERVTGIGPDLQSFVVLYGANIGDRASPLNGVSAFEAVVSSGRYPAASEPIQMGLHWSESRDHEPGFWEEESRNLTRQFERLVRPLLENRKAHLSVFALAPQPLLAYLGHLLSDLFLTELYQRHRNPDQWTWYRDTGGSLSVQAPPGEGAEAKEIALILSVSAAIDPERVTSVLGQDVPIWEIGASNPSVHFLRTREQLDEFSRVYRGALAQIRSRHGPNATVHVFPAVPHTMAVEIGRSCNPKVDLPLIIYDHNNRSGGFVKALEIK